MNDRETRLRERIDVLLDERDVLRERLDRLILAANAGRRRNLTRDKANAKVRELREENRKLHQRLRVSERERELSEARERATRHERDTAKRFLRNARKAA